MAQELNEQQTAFVGFYLGEARMNATRAAEMAGYKHPLTQGPRLLGNVLVQAQIDEWREEVKKRAIANVEYRVAKLDELEKRYWDLIDARSSELGEEVAGGDTGLLVKQEKVIGTGNSAQHITEYKADTAVTKEIRELHKQAAQELGQWIEKNEHGGPNGEPLTLIINRPPGETK
jgi:phage terminase small subunit